MVVIVAPLAEWLRSRITEAPLLCEEAGREHTVFAYGPPERAEVEAGTALNASEGPGGTASGEPGNLAESEMAGNRADFLRKWPAYFRGAADYTLEEVSYHIDAFQGVADFDTPGMAVQTAAKLISRLAERESAHWLNGLGKQETEAPPGSDLPEPAILVYEPDQGHFPAWLASRLDRRPDSRDSAQAGGAATPFKRWVLSGRNILALEAARHNLALSLGGGGAGGGGTWDNSGADKAGAAIIVAPSADPALDQEALGAAAGSGGRFGLIVFFPESVPQTDRRAAWWEAMAGLLAPGGIVIAACSASEAERLDRHKPKGFTRLGDIKRAGFRALGYRFL
jgi:hypothetical protein